MFELFNSKSQHSRDIQTSQRPRDENEKRTSDRMWNQWNKQADKRIQKALYQAQKWTDQKEEIKIDDQKSPDIYWFNVHDEDSD